jgi:hypothetical protein
MERSQKMLPSPSELIIDEPSIVASDFKSFHLKKRGRPRKLANFNQPLQISKVNLPL